jgi:DNA polymerase-1
MSTVQGFFQMLHNVLHNQQLTHIAVAFDIKKPTFRHVLYNKYKAHRKPMPVEIQNSIPIIKSILKLMNIVSVELEGYEADDIIGTLAKRASAQNFKVIMVTPDKDFYQLIDHNISICKLSKPGKDLKFFGVNEIRNRFSVSNTSQIADIMALCGDPTDNIPGIPGIGNRIARKLISQFGSIEVIYENLNILSSKHRELFINNKEVLELSKKLVTIDTNVPINNKIDDFKVGTINSDALKSYMLELNQEDFASKYVNS